MVAHSTPSVSCIVEDDAAVADLKMVNQHNTPGFLQLRHAVKSQRFAERQRAFGHVVAARPRGSFSIFSCLRQLPGIHYLVDDFHPCLDLGGAITYSNLPICVTASKTSFTHSCLIGQGWSGIGWESCHLVERRWTS